MIRGDSQEYELLKRWCDTLSFKNKPNHVTTCEIGIREGLSSKIIMMSMKAKINGTPYHHIGIDPYNNLEYQHYDHTESETCDYTNEMRDTMLKDFAEHKEEFLFYNITDIEYMNKHCNLDVTYDLVHFDGPHMTKDVLREAIWFADRTRDGSRLIFDDHDLFDMRHVAMALTYFNFKVLEEGKHKICLIRDDNKS